MQKTNLTHLMARATVLLIAMFCFLGEAKASDVGLYGTWLESVGDTKIEVIKALKPFVNDLQVAKHLVEGAPDYMLRNVTQEEAQACADALNAAGATAYAIKMNAKFLPYEYGFENRDPEGEGWSRVDCINYTKVYGVICNTGDYSFGFSASNNPPQYLISPELVDRTSIRVSLGTGLAIRTTSKPSRWATPRPPTISVPSHGAMKSQPTSEILSNTKKTSLQAPSMSL